MKTRCFFHRLPSLIVMRILVTLVGLFWSGAIMIRADTHYVSPDGTNDVANGYITWAGAATQIQWAVNAATNGETVLVTNGTYDTGSVRVGTNLVWNRVAVTNAITLRSVNGSTVTLIKGAADGVTGACGDDAVRCVYLAYTNVTLIGFTLTNGHTRTNGQSTYDTGAGGVLLCTNTVVSNCVITGNRSHGWGAGASLQGGTMANCVISGNTNASAGGGVDTWIGAKLNNCTITGNSAGYDASGQLGGGVALYLSTMNNCTVTGNSSGYGGGVRMANWSSMYNCVVAGNTAGRTYGGGVSGDAKSFLYNCTVASNTACTVGGGVYFLNPTDKLQLVNCIIWGNAPDNVVTNGGTSTYIYNCSDPILVGDGNIDLNPTFVDTNAANYRLSGSSPCINSGTNYSWMTNAIDVRSVDLDGNRRIRYGTVDMGAYELLHSGTICSFH